MSLKKKKKKRTDILGRLPFWIVGFQAAFLAIFALDVFGEYRGLELLIALFMHLVPSMLLLVVMAIAWRRHVLGGWLLVFLGGVSVLFFKTYRDPITLLIVSAPVLVSGWMLLKKEKVGSDDDGQRNGEAN